MESTFVLKTLIISQLRFMQREINHEDHSLGRKKILIFAEFSGTVEDKGHYTVIKNPSNPGYHWSNYIIFDRVPKVGDLTEWKSLFDREFPYYKEPHHYAFTWDCDGNGPGDYSEFLADGFESDSGVALTTMSLDPPSHANDDLDIRVINSDQE